MNILVINGSPKGKNSVTLQTVNYLQILHPEHHFEVLHAAQTIKSLEKDFSPALAAIEQALLLPCLYLYGPLPAPPLRQLLKQIRSFPGNTPPSSPPPSIFMT